MFLINNSTEEVRNESISNPNDFKPISLERKNCECRLYSLHEYDLWANGQQTNQTFIRKNYEKNEAFFSSFLQTIITLNAF
jgi:hypothetical protein